MTTHTISSFGARMIANGYPFECACGEHHKTAQSAIQCSKCRVYASGEERIAYDERTGTTQTFSDVFPQRTGV